MKLKTKKLILFSTLIISALTAFSCMILNHFLYSFNLMILGGFAGLVFLLSEWLVPKILGLPVVIVDIKRD